MSFKGVSIFSSGGNFVQQSGTILALLVEDHPNKQFCDIILKSVRWSRRSHIKVFLLFSSGGHFVSAEQNDFSNFDR